MYRLMGECECGCGKRFAVKSQTKIVDVPEVAPNHSPVVGGKTATTIALEALYAKVGELVGKVDAEQAIRKHLEGRTLWRRFRDFFLGVKHE